MTLNQTQSHLQGAKGRRKGRGGGAGGRDLFTLTHWLNTSMIPLCTFLFVFFLPVFDFCLELSKQGDVPLETKGQTSRLTLVQQNTSKVVKKLKWLKWEGEERGKKKARRSQSLFRVYMYVNCLVRRRRRGKAREAVSKIREKGKK